MLILLVFVLFSEMNITGRLPEAGNLKLIITRLLPEKKMRSHLMSIYIKAGRKLSKMDQNTSNVLVNKDKQIFKDKYSDNQRQIFRYLNTETLLK